MPPEDEQRLTGGEKLQGRREEKKLKDAKKNKKRGSKKYAK